MVTGKVLGIGLARTGTTSLVAALEILGYKGIHNPRSYTLLAEHDVAADVPIAVAFKALDIMYPRSKFVLTVRQTDTWLASIKHLFGVLAARETKPRAIEGMGPKAHMGVYGTWTTFDPENLREAYRRHEEDVRRYFNGRESMLLTLDICGGEGWEKLCPFLGKEIPSQPFPRAHTIK